MPLRGCVGWRSLVGLVMLSLLVGPAVAQQEAPALRRLRLADYYEFVELGELALAPDASRIVFARTEIDAEQDTRTTSLWSITPDGGDLHQLAAEGTSPHFAPDGLSMAYLHERQVWLLPFAGGEPWQLTALPGGVSDFDWAPDSRRIVLVSQEAAEAIGPSLPDDQRADFIEVPLPVDLETLAPLDAGEWIPSGPVDPPRGDEAEGGEDEDVAALEGIAADPDDAAYPAGGWVEPLAEPAPVNRPVPAVISRLQFKADGSGYVGSRPRHLFVVEVPASVQKVAARRLTGGRFSDGSPQWSPDGRWIAFASNHTAEPDTNNNSDIWLVAAQGGVVLRVTDSEGEDGTPRWSPDSTHLAYRHVPRHPAIYANDHLRLVALSASVAVEDGHPQIEVGVPTELTAALDRPLGSAAFWAHDRASVYVTLLDRGTVSLIQVSTGLGRLTDRSQRRRRMAPPLPAGTSAAIIAGPRAVGEFEIMPGGRQVVAVLSAGTEPPELYRARAIPQAGIVPMRWPAGHVSPTSTPPRAELRALTQLNAGWRTRVDLAEPEPLRFRSSADVMVEGWLLRPPSYQEGKRYPLIVRIHGGPVSQFTWEFSWERQWLAAQDYAVLYLNPRGSSGYGEEFALALWADWGGPDFDDVLAGVDHVIGRGIADPERVGVGGWSYGGILTNYMITKSRRFAAAISGASETDYFSSYGTDDLQRWWEDELGLPYEAASRARYERLSPIRAVAKIETPTLFMVGGEDARVPPSQSEQMYTQLRRRMVDGGPQTGLIVYPGESHGLSKPSFIIDRWLRYRAWYDLFLKDDLTADPFFGLRAW